MKRERSQKSESRRKVAGWLPGRWALALGLLLGAGCATPRPQFIDADWVSHSTTGRGAFERGDFRRAADAYGRAQQRARALDDADALAVAAVNRAVCLLAIDRPAEAREAIEEALADGRVAVRRQAELLAWGARVSLALGDPVQALAQAEHARKLSRDPLVQAQVRLAQSAAHLAQDNAAAAVQVLTDGMSAKKWAGLPAVLRAEQAERLGQIAAAQDRSAAAANLQDGAATLWSEAGRLPQMARALAEAGRQHRAAGDPSSAGDRFWRAARSLWAQGLSREAVQVLEEGVACAAEADDEETGRRLAELVVTFRNSRRLNQTEPTE